MALVLAETDEAQSEGNEAIAYLVDHGVQLDEQQTSQLQEMNLSKADLSNMTIELDPSGAIFNDFCNELKFGVRAKLKLRSAITALSPRSKSEPSASAKKVAEEKFTKTVKRMKIAVIGNSGVGKSSLLTRFLDDTFDENCVETVGVDTRDEVIDVADTEVHLTLLDTAGQERFGSIAN